MWLMIMLILRLPRHNSRSAGRRSEKLGYQRLHALPGDWRRQLGLLIRMNEIIFRLLELVIRCYEILIRTNELLICLYELLFRSYEVILFHQCTLWATVRLINGCVAL